MKRPRNQPKCKKSAPNEGNETGGSESESEAKVAKKRSKRAATKSKSRKRKASEESEESEEEIKESEESEESDGKKSKKRHGGKERRQTAPGSDAARLLAVLDERAKARLELEELELQRLRDELVARKSQMPQSQSEERR